jgi:hypothetical protein
VVVAAAVAAQLAAALQTLGGDDIYVLRNLRAPEWGRRLNAFTLDAPSPDYMPWWEGLVLQRRFIRVPGSALLWLQSEVFGLHGLPYHLVTLSLVAASCFLLYVLASRHLSLRYAAALGLVPAFHPAASEVVGNLNCQPLALAGLFSLGAVAAWVRMRENGSRPALAASLFLCALAVTSYEAAFALAPALLFADLVVAPSPATTQGRWTPRFALLAVDAAYVPWAVWIRHGLSAPDTTPLRPLGEVARALRLDDSEYAFKALGVFMPTTPSRYWLDGVLGEPAALALVVGLVLAVGWRIRRSRWGWVGLASCALFLAPPLVTRATVSQLNLPLLRQLYLPILMGGPLLLVGLAGRALRLPVAVAGGAWLLVLAVESAVAGGPAGAPGPRGEVTREEERLLAGLPRDKTVIGVGDWACGTAPSLVWPGTSSLAIPGGVEAAGPELVAVDAHTLVAIAPEGFNIPVVPEAPDRDPGPNRGPMWTPVTPPALVENGWQRISGATVAVETRTERRLMALRYRFDVPLSDVVFLRFRGCGAPSMMTPHALR